MNKGQTRAKNSININCLKSEQLVILGWDFNLGSYIPVLIFTCFGYVLRIVFLPLAKKSIFSKKIK